MRNFHICVIKIKNYILPTLFTLFTIFLVVFSSSNLSAAKNGLNLWATSVLPSLFPFFVATELLSKTEIPYILGRFLNIFMKPLFNVSGEGAFGFIMGVISGYPIGAKIACNFRKNNSLSKAECERLLAFTNNSGPLFIIGTVGINMFGSSTIGFLLLFTHLLASLTVGILFRYWKKSDVKETRPLDYNVNHKNHKKVTFSNLGGTIAESISSATSTIIMIGGFIVLFSVIISILNSSHFTNILNNLLAVPFSLLHIPSSFISPIFTGILEITNGISLISNITIKNISLNIIITSFILGMGGISVLLQVWSIVAKSDLSIKPYIYGKFLQGCFSAFYTFIFIMTFPMFNFNL